VEKCILAVWRVPYSTKDNKEEICFRMYGRTWAYSTMEKWFNIVANRCAAYAEMMGAPVE